MKGFCRWNSNARNKTGFFRQRFYFQIFIKCTFTYIIL